MIVSTVFPFPKDNGKKIILNTLLKYLIDKFGEENITYTLIGNEEYDLGPYNRMKMHKIRKTNSIKRMINIFKYSLIMRNKSIQEAVIFNKEIQGKVRHIVEKNAIDIVIYDTLRISQMFEDTKMDVEEYVYMDDLFSVRYEKMLQAMNTYKNLNFDTLGNFKTFIPKFAHSLVNLKFLNKFLLRYESNLIYKREIETTKKFSYNLLISNKEIDELKKRSKKENIYLVRPCLREVIKYQRRYDGNQTFVFLGSLNIPHNNASISNFISKNMNYLIKTIPNIKLKIIGKYPSTELLELVKEYPDNVELLGYVEDLEEVFNTACAMIIPLLFGSGVKIKTLEALSYGLPTITTDFGIEGIDVTEETCLISNEIDKFPYLMKKLINIDINNVYSKRSFNFYKENYSKEAVNKLLDKYFLD